MIDLKQEGCQSKVFLALCALAKDCKYSHTQVGDHLLKHLRALQDKHDIIGDVRGSGLMLGIELVKDRGTKVGCVCFLVEL